ncbi:hypothetical protein HGRIS_010530 [Hohenbuehelia grisea]|uniref:Uncharacterized protein n=1 Tax=Hohenbuehelia grisea TaxID=104357 RepID=A0ABR3IXF8_9AGAR
MLKSQSAPFARPSPGFGSIWVGNLVAATAREHLYVLPNSSETHPRSLIHEKRYRRQFTTTPYTSSSSQTAARSLSASSTPRTGSASPT